MNPATPIVSGVLSELDLSKILAVTSLGRVPLRLEISGPTGDPLGAMVLKAGRVLDATAGPLRGEAALEQLLSADRLARFRIWRETSPTRDMPPLCTVHDVTSRPGPSTTGPRNRARVMEGSLADFDLATLLQSLSIGRQYTEVAVFTGDGARLGRVVMKSGKVLSAFARNAQGKSAIAVLLAAPKHARFEVVRLDPALDPDLANATPMGSLAQILFQLTEPRSTAATGPVPRVHVMSGLLSAFDVPTLLQTIGVGRQHLQLEIYDGPALLGSIHTKASMLLSASAGHEQGLVALARLVTAPARGQFKVFRVVGNPVTDPLGAIGPLLMHVVRPHVAVAGIAQPTIQSAVSGARAGRWVPDRTWLRLGAGVGAALCVVAAVVWLAGTRDSGPAPVARTTTQATTQAAPPALVAPAASQPSAEPVAQEPPAPVADEPATAESARDERQVTPSRPVRRTVRMPVWRAQAVLDRLGYDVGPIDNVFGPRTAAAVTTFQQAVGLRSTGALDNATIRALRARAPR